MAVVPVPRLLVAPITTLPPRIATSPEKVFAPVNTKVPLPPLVNPSVPASTAETVARLIQNPLLLTVMTGKAEPVVGVKVRVFEAGTSEVSR